VAAQLEVQRREAWLEAEGGVQLTPEETRKRDRRYARNKEWLDQNPDYPKVRMKERAGIPLLRPLSNSGHLRDKWDAAYGKAAGQ
jgi:hypothetical protein